MPLQSTRESTRSSAFVIEQAKGAISVRCGVPVDVAFEMLRGVARSNQRNLPEFAADVVADGGRFGPATRCDRALDGIDEGAPLVDGSATIISARRPTMPAAPLEASLRTLTRDECASV